jgi:hypothetical protein
VNCREMLLRSKPRHTAGFISDQARMYLRFRVDEFVVWYGEWSWYYRCCGAVYWLRTSVLALYSQALHLQTVYTRLGVKAKLYSC